MSSPLVSSGVSGGQVFVSPSMFVYFNRTLIVVFDEI
jgi:hypothetical protein